MRINTNVLPFYASQEEQHHLFRSYAQGIVAEIYTPVNTIPAFQLIRTDAQGAPLTATLHKIEDNTTTDISAALTASGLEFDNTYDNEIIIYPATLDIGSSYTEGPYYLEITDGTNTWVSEIFTMRENRADLVKLTYWHLEDFCVNEQPEHIIRYKAPFKHTSYIETTVARPTYPYTREISTRLGRNFDKQFTSAKQYQFIAWMTEDQIDALRLAPLHDKKNVTFQGRTIEVDELLMSDPEWEDDADLGKVTVTFRSNTVAITGGRATTETAYEPNPGACVDTDYICKAVIDQASPEFTSGTYIDGNGQEQTISAGQYMMVEASGNFRVYQWGGSAYTIVTHSLDEVAYVETESQYYAGSSAATFRKPSITGYSTATIPPTIFGRGIPGAAHKIYSVEGTTETYLGETTYEQLDLGYQTNIPAGAEKIRMKVSSGPCGVFDQPADYVLPLSQDEGIGFDIIGTSAIGPG
jgi:hypothetical protein